MHSSLRLYDGCWPLRVIHDFRVEKHLRLYVYPNAKKLSNASKSRPSVRRPLRNRARSKSADIPATRTLRSATRTMSDTQSPAPAHRQRATKRRDVHSRKLYVIPTERKRRSTVVSPSPSPPPSMRQAKPVFYSFCGRATGRLLNQTESATQTAHPASSRPNEAWVATATVHVGCLDCGCGPRSAGDDSDLRSAIEGEREYLCVLFDGGLVDDHHLKIFRSWPPGYRALLIKDLPATPFVRQVLLQKLGYIAPLHPAYGGPSGDSAHQSPTGDRTTSGPSTFRHPEPTRSFSGILQPSRVLEEELTDPSQRIDRLRSAMELDNRPELFDEVLVCLVVGHRILGQPNPRHSNSSGEMDFLTYYPSNPRKRR